MEGLRFPLREWQHTSGMTGVQGPQEDEVGPEIWTGVISGVLL